MNTTTQGYIYYTDNSLQKTKVSKHLINLSGDPGGQGKSMTIVIEVFFLFGLKSPTEG